MVKVNRVFLTVCLVCLSVHTTYSQVGIDTFVRDVNAQYQKIAHKQDKAIRKFARIAFKEHPELHEEMYSFIPIYGIYTKNEVLKRTDYPWLSKDSLFTYLNVKSMTVSSVLIYKDGDYCGCIDIKARDGRLKSYIQPIYKSDFMKDLAEKLLKFGCNHAFCICDQTDILITSDNKMRIYARKKGDVFTEYNAERFLQECITNKYDLYRYISQDKSQKGFIVY